MSRTGRKEAAAFSDEDVVVEPPSQFVRIMKWPFALALLLWTACTPMRQSVPPSGSAGDPGQDWQRIPDPAALGYSRAGLDSALAVARGMKTSALLVAVGGRSLLEYGDLADTSYIASARKSVLSMLYGKYVENGTIRLDETLAEIGLDDRSALLPLERTATVEHLLGARSGVYHPASNPGDALVMAPPRGSQKPGTYNLYSNWDFNALGTIFEKKTGRGIYDAFESDIARPIGMQDFHRSVHKRQGDTTKSTHPAYHFVLSTRDMARLGHLMLRDGRWGGGQVIPTSWVRRSTRTVTPPAEMNPPGIRAQASAYGQGYSFLWWTRVRPDTTDVFHGAYAAEGAFGQYILVVPKLDMVVAHKVVARGGPSQNPSVTLPQFEALVRAVAAARCRPVAAGATPPQHASPRRAGQAAPCHFAVPPFTAHWGPPALPEGRHRAAPAAGMVGEYETEPGRGLRITLEDGHLRGEQTGSPKQPLVHVSGTTFGVGRADGPTTLTFTVGANGRATALVMRENGSERTLPRVR
jgi:CubicO group peptidase (beta-lactamase class C family)